MDDSKNHTSFTSPVDDSFKELLLTDLERAAQILERDSSLAEPTANDRLRLTSRLCSILWLVRRDRDNLNETDTGVNLLHSQKLVSALWSVVLDEDNYYVLHEDDGSESWVDYVACVRANLNLGSAQVSS